MDNLWGKGSSRPELFWKKSVRRNFTKFPGKHLRQSLFLIKLQPLLKKRLWHWCFPVNFAKFLRTPFFTEHLWWLLLEERCEGKSLANPSVLNLSSETEFQRIANKCKILFTEDEVHALTLIKFWIIKFYFMRIQCLYFLLKRDQMVRRRTISNYKHFFAGKI